MELEHVGGEQFGLTFKAADSRSAEYQNPESARRRTCRKSISDGSARPVRGSNIAPSLSSMTVGALRATRASADDIGLFGSVEAVMGPYHDTNLSIRATHPHGVDLSLNLLGRTPLILICQQLPAPASPLPAVRGTDGRTTGTRHRPPQRRPPGTPPHQRIGDTPRSAPRHHPGCALAWRFGPGRSLDAAAALRGSPPRRTRSPRN